MPDDEAPSTLEPQVRWGASLEGRARRGKEKRADTDGYSHDVNGASQSSVQVPLCSVRVSRVTGGVLCCKNSVDRCLRDTSDLSARLGYISNHLCGLGGKDVTELTPSHISLHPVSTLEKTCTKTTPK